MSDKHLSTTALAKSLNKESKELFILLAQGGWISKIDGHWQLTEKGKFEGGIYINHPNGLTTLYAHLNNFMPGLEEYVKEQQYKLKSWKVFLDIPVNLFPVTKGMFIAYSGNTGGSQGPHVHFEIRDTKTDKVLNPSLFNLPIADNAAPDILRLAVYDRCISTYEQSPKFYTLKKVNGVYITSPALIITNTDKVSFGISAFDRFFGYCIFIRGIPLAPLSVKLIDGCTKTQANRWR